MELFSLGIAPPVRLNDDGRLTLPEINPNIPDLLYLPRVSQFYQKSSQEPLDSNHIFKNNSVPGDPASCFYDFINHQGFICLIGKIASHFQGVIVLLSVFHTLHRHLQIMFVQLRVDVFLDHHEIVGPSFFFSH